MQLGPRVLKNIVMTNFVFLCKVCNHEFKCTLRSVSGVLRSWFYYCVNKRLCEDTRSCTVYFAKTFATTLDAERVSAWSQKNPKTSWQTFKNSAKVGIFDCKKCGK